MALKKQQKNFLKAKAHGLKSLIQIGKEGFDDRQMKSLDTALNDHELLKINILHGDEVDKKELVATIATAVNAELVQMVGFKFVLYRHNPLKEKGLVLPND